MTLLSVTELLRSQVEIALASVPHAGSLGWDVFWWQPDDQAGSQPSLWLILVVPNPSIGHPPITVKARLVTPWMDQEEVTRLVADGARFARSQQRAALS